MQEIATPTEILTDEQLRGMELGALDYHIRVIRREIRRPSPGSHPLATLATYATRAPAILTDRIFATSRARRRQG